MFKRKLAYTDEEVISAIRAGGVERERATRFLNRSYAGFISKMVKRYNVEWDDCKDIYVDTLVTLIKKLRSDEYQGTGKLSTYFYSIFSNKCIDWVRQISTLKHSQTKNWTYELPEIRDSSRDFLQNLIANEKMEAVKGYLDKIGEKCKQLILDLDYWGFKPDEMVERMGFSSTASVKTQKYKCKEKLKTLLKATQMDSKID